MKMLWPGLAMFAGVALAQQPGIPPVLGRFPLIPLASYAVQGAPFTALMRVTWTDGPGVEGGVDLPASMRRTTLLRVVRDSAGRQRFERPAAEEALEKSVEGTVLIEDVVSGRTIALVPGHHAASVRLINGNAKPVVIDVAARKGFPCSVPENGAKLGLKNIAGQEVCGQKLTDREFWLSTGYLMPMKAVWENTPLGTITEEVTRFDAGEPDKTNFQVPEGYQMLAAPPGGTAMKGVSPPVILYQPEPEFSEEARTVKIKGNVLVGLTVSEKGQPTEVHLIRGIGHGLDGKALQAVSRYRFRPAMKDGVPVAFPMNVEVNFEIR